MGDEERTGQTGNQKGARNRNVSDRKEGPIKKVKSWFLAKERKVEQRRRGKEGVFGAKRKRKLQGQEDWGKRVSRWGGSG